VSSQTGQEDFLLGARRHIPRRTSPAEATRRHPQRDCASASAAEEHAVVKSLLLVSWFSQVRERTYSGGMAGLMP
jgi:hypothetical protein